MDRLLEGLRRRRCQRGGQVAVGEEDEEDELIAQLQEGSKPARRN